MLFSSKNTTHYVLTIGIIIITSYVASQYKNSFTSNKDDEAIRKYLLNDLPLYGHGRKKIWIHTKYEVNSRIWKDFSSRNTTDLNQPYLHLTIKSIIEHCGDDFHICLIDDKSFSSLLPSWDIEINNIAEPMKHYYRELGILKLIHSYGGMTVPNSFVCLRNLKGLYEDGTDGNMPFVCESINKTRNLLKQPITSRFIPDTYFIGADKEDEVIAELIEKVTKMHSKGHFSSEPDFKGIVNQILCDNIENNKMNLISASAVGVKNNKDKPILLEDLMEEGYLKLHPEAYGIYIPSDELLRRPKYQWFSVLSSEEVLNANICISKYITLAISESMDEYKPKKKMRSVATL